MMTYRGLHFPEYTNDDYPQTGSLKLYAFYGGTVRSAYQIERLVDEMVKNYMWIPPTKALL